MENKHADIIKKIYDNYKMKVHFSFVDNDTTNYPDGISVNINNNDFIKLKAMTNMNFAKLGDSYLEYIWFISILRTNAIPYESHSYEIDW